jgi:TPP-dependent pyruvate/acetoin dehydrogenase alpha subunit
MSMSAELLSNLYETMVRVRLFEDKTKELFLKGKIRGTIHVSQGQEAVAAGGCLALRPDDYILTNHRGHGHCIAKGVSSRALLAEILGRETGCCRGRAGSLHAFDAAAGVLGASAIVGAGIPQANGVALGLQLLGRDQVVLKFFGDGAANQGTFHEALNLASVWKLPVIFLCENNQVADTTPYSATINVPDVAVRASGYGIPGEVVDGNDVEAVYTSVHAAADRARAGAGPTLIECKTYRWEGHHVGDPCLWRRKGELEEWKGRCPIRRLRARLIEGKVRSEEELDALDRRAGQEMEDAAQFAQESPLPPPGTALDYVWG